MKSHVWYPWKPMSFSKWLPSFWVELWTIPCLTFDLHEDTLSQVSQTKTTLHLIQRYYYISEKAKDITKINPGYHTLFSFCEFLGNMSGFNKASGVTGKGRACENTGPKHQ